MITQLLLNYLAQDLAAFWSIVPALPGTLDSTVINPILAAESWFTSHLGDVGVVVPWGEMTSLVGVFIGILVFWVAVQAIRVVLWLVNR